MLEEVSTYMLGRNQVSQLWMREAHGALLQLDLILFVDGSVYNVSRDAWACMSCTLLAEGKPA